jgi:ClpA/ClpB-like protein
MPKATTVRFSDEVYARLDQASARTGMPVNSIVVAACLEWMERHTPGATAANLQVLAPAPRWSTIRRAVELAAAKRPAPGMYPFEAFSESAQKLLTASQAEAQNAGFSYIGTEHILLAALADPPSQATRILANLGLSDGNVRPAVQKLIKEHRQSKTPVVVPTSRVKTVIELAFKLCQSAGDSRVTTGHVLLAMAVEGKGIAAHVMKDMGADRDAIERELEQAQPEP